jgi:tetratricopeptide (TPR) repeat protein
MASARQRSSSANSVNRSDTSARPERLRPRSGADSEKTRNVSLSVSPGWKRPALICLLLTIVTLSAYAAVTRHPFVNYDDEAYVVNNSHVNTGLNWQNLKWALTGFAVGNWHPLTWMSHALDCQLFGLGPAGHHVTSLLLHVLNVTLLFLLLNRVTGRIGASLFVAGIFALHPLDVESVAWVAERKNVLCTFFFLLALGAYGWYAQKPEVKRYLWVVGLFLLGLASKPMVITFPFVVLLLDFWPLGRMERWSRPSAAFPVPQQSLSRLVLDKLPLLGISLVSAFVTIVAQRRSNAISSASVWPLAQRLANAVCSYAMYLWKALVPTGLAPFYPPFVIPPWRLGLAAASIVAVSTTVWRHKSGRLYLLVGWLWFLGTLVPVIGFIQVGGQSMADRYTYIPLIGIVVAIVWAASEAADAVRLGFRWRVGLAAAFLGVMSLLTWHQVAYWKSSDDLWTRTLQVTTNNFVAEENLAVALTNLGRDPEALPHYIKAEALMPNDPTARLNLGNNLARQGLYPDTAIEQFEAFIRLNQEPRELISAYRGLGVAYAALGNRTKARESFRQALRLNPEGQTELYNLSLLEIQDGVDKMSRLVSMHPSAQGYLQLGQLLQEDRLIADAQVAYRKALRLNPDLAEAKEALRQLSDSGESE